MPWRIILSQCRFRASSQYAFAKSNKPVTQNVLHIRIQFLMVLTINISPMNINKGRDET